MPHQLRGVRCPRHVAVEERHQPLVEVFASAAHHAHARLAQGRHQGVGHRVDLLHGRGRLLRSARKTLVDAAAHAPDLAAPDLAGDLCVHKEALRLGDVGEVRGELLQHGLGVSRMEDRLTSPRLTLMLIQDVIAEHLVQVIEIAVVIDEKLDNPGGRIRRRHGLQRFLDLLGVLLQNLQRHGLGGNGG